MMQARKIRYDVTGRTDQYEKVSVIKRHVRYRQKSCPSEDATIDKNLYFEILENHLLPWATKHNENGHSTLQQDGTPVHRAKSTEDWCLANLPDASEWLANSPDLNVLDFSIWAILKQKACQKKHTNVQAFSSVWRKLGTKSRKTTCKPR
ncbi:hypothetical protein ANCDUO_15186 [Ancylostoma duodenale]|uniref:Tc1-like transposase DDE domain-containing protein n=1 Tax=Ancylostoma duodenale TaxID=51022 RepID=A0A0C2CXT4_9BILA|nr:hypothetical protein ANCDUO_15186 [Ancylostoma duodenale]